MRWLLILVLTAGLARAEGERAGDFDYYVLSLSWSPSWCATEGAARGSPQCDRAAGFGWVLHGLWPQDEDGGWPEYCRATERDPSRAETAAMADIMGTPGAAWYQWKKHGRCSGLASGTYFAAARRLYDALDLDLPDAPRATAAEVEAALLAANPALGPDDLIVTCDDGRLAEVRICLTREFAPRRCAPDVERDACRSRAPLDLPVAP